MKLPKEKQITGFRTDIDAGYYRDAYNDSNLLWKFDLSYWNDIPKLCNDKSEMPVENIKKLLQLLTDRQPAFLANLKACSEADAEYFLEKEKELKRFLELAIELNSKIECSV